MTNRTWRRVSSRLFLAGLSALAVCGPAHAAPEAPIFVPTSAWLVGPASLAVPAGEARVPCVMANQFDNGFTLRISGGGGRILALAVDVRQGAFTAGQPYPVALRIGKDYAADFEGTAYNPATLIVNTQDEDDLYAALRSGRSLALDIAGQTFEFAILGTPDGISRMESCFAGAPDEERRASPPPMPSPSMMEEAPEGGMEFEPGNALPPDMRSADQAPPADIEPAAGRAAAMPAPQSADVSRNAKATVTGWHPPAPKPVQRPDIIASASTGAALPASGADVEKRWRALKGANLRDVLEIWSKNAETDLVWMAGRDFPVKESVIRQGPLEGAVLELLQQYDADEARPVGKLYNDPAMNRRVLLIHSEQGT